MKKEVKIISSLLLGIVAGTATGILLAPSSGRKTRKNIRKRASRLVDDAREAVSGSVDKAVSGIGDSLDLYSPMRRSSMIDILGI